MAGVFVNIKNLVYAPLDEKTGIHGTVKPVAPLMSIKVDTNTAAETLRGDGRPRIAATSTNETTIEISTNDLPTEIHAEWMGHHLDESSGLMTEKSGDFAPYFALGFEIEKENNTSCQYWYLKGKFEEPGIDAKQREEKITFSTPTVKGTFVYMESGEKRYMYDTEIAETPLNDFLKTVYKPATPPGV